MRTEQRTWSAKGEWRAAGPGLGPAAQLALVFGKHAALGDQARIAEIKSAYPAAELFGCTTAGQISGTKLLEDDLVVTAVAFEHTQVRSAHVAFDDCKDSYDAGARLAHALSPAGLVHVLVLSDGIAVNGSELSRGLQAHVPKGVAVTGGLSGDDDRFQRTLVLAGAEPRSRCVAVVGLYGPRLRVGYGSLGGWDPFGPERAITRSKGNVLYELDGQPALALYRAYLGEHAAGLPATALLFPLAIRTADGQRQLVRTVLQTSDADGTMTFAGDMPQGSFARLMKANFERLVDGAQGAASAAYQSLGSTSPSLALLISCIGRKLVLKQRTEEELEAVQHVLGERAALTGFYSYGEICPAAPEASCELQNQTMTITTLVEV
jgi:hypothetical protein